MFEEKKANQQLSSAIHIVAIIYSTQPVAHFDPPPQLASTFRLQLLHAAASKLAPPTVLPDLIIVDSERYFGQIQPFFQRRQRPFVIFIHSDGAVSALDKWIDQILSIDSLPSIWSASSPFLSFLSIQRGIRLLHRMKSGVKLIKSGILSPRYILDHMNEQIYHHQQQQRRMVDATNLPCLMNGIIMYWEEKLCTKPLLILQLQLTCTYLELHS